MFPMDKLVRSYRDLVAWQKAMDLVGEIYRVSVTFPKEEVFGLTSQLRRAAVSIPSNIAEGQAKSSRGEFQLYLGHSRGSLAEMETQIMIARNLNYLGEAEAVSLLEQAAEVGRILNGLLAALKAGKK
jgi:four helix bundle protein